MPKENLEILIDKLKKLRLEINNIEDEIQHIYLEEIQPDIDKGEFDAAREALQGMPECSAKFNLLRYIRAKENESL